MIGAEFSSPGGLALLAVSWLLKGSLVLTLALAAALAARRQSAALRHRIWTAAFVGLLLIPLLGTVAPRWHLPLIDGPETPVAVAPERSAERPGSADPATAGGPEAARLTERLEASEGMSSLESRQANGPWALRWGLVAAAVWALGALFLLARLAMSALFATRVCRNAAPVEQPEWRRLFDRARRQLGIQGQVRLLRSGRVSMPMAWGMRRHVVLLPESAEGWTEERRQVVLLHELAHVRRADCLSHVLAALAAAVHWFNPLVWVARRHQVAERELACDDAVLASGARGADYAWHLLEIARASGPGRGLAPAGVMMARKSQLEGRLLAVLDGSRDRSNPSRLGSFGLSLSTLAVIMVLGGLQPWAAPAEAAQPPTGVSSATLPPLPEAGGGLTAAELESAQQNADTRARVIELMTRLLQDPDGDVRRDAVMTLGRMEDAGAIDALARAVTDDADADVRASAAWALGMIEDDRGVDALSRAISEDVDADVRSRAAWALGMIESPAGVPAVAPGLRDADVDVRAQSAWALGMIESAEAVDVLVEALRTETDADVRSQVAWALGMIEDESAIEALIDAVEDTDAGVRKNALWAINQIIG